MSERKTLADQKPLTVRTAVGERVGHPSENPKIERGLISKEPSSNSAHGYSFEAAGGAGFRTERTR